MSKIVCEICGTTYDDTTGPCPVCGWNPGTQLDTTPEDLDDIMADDFQLDEAEADEAPQKGKPVFDYDAVNPAGGRRRRPTAPQPAAPVQEPQDEEEEEESGSNKFLVFVLVVLILALLAVSGYIAYTKLWKPNQKGSDANKPQDVITAQPVDETEPTVTVGGEEATVATVPEVTDPTIPCTELSLVSNMDTLTFAGQNWRLLVKSAPENTTDKVTYTSGDESVVTVDEFGRVTAIGEGETVIVISCGDKRVETRAVVRFDTGTAETPTEAPTTSAGGAAASGTTTAAPATGSELRLKKSDITLNTRGLYVTLELENGIAAEDVKWSTSDSSIANVYNGNVTGIGRGVCVIRAEYNGQVAECVVRCIFR